MLADHVIEEGTLVLAGDRVRLSIRLPWYRALPLSSVTGVEWEIDGQAIPHDSVTFALDGRARGLDELPALHEENWYVLDSAVLEGDAPEGLADTASHEVRVRIGAYIPYLPAGDGVIAIREQDVKTLELTTEELA